MGGKGLVFVAAISLLGAVALAEPPLLDGAGQPRPLPRPAIILFWAAWCAPCRAEVDGLAELTAAAQPLPIVVVATDASRPSRKLLGHLPAASVRFPARGSDGVMAMVPGGVGALPAAMAIGTDGKPCAQAQGAVDPATLRAWRKACLP